MMIITWNSALAVSYSTRLTILGLGEVIYRRVVLYMDNRVNNETQTNGI